MHKISRLKSAACLLFSVTVRGKLRQLSNASYNVPEIKMKIIPAPPVIGKTYIQKNKSLKRALSPHLTIYKPQITSMMSITLRMTGLALGIALWIVCVTKLISDKDVDYFIELLKDLQLDDCYWTSTKTIMVFPFSFHLVAGMRHLMFDTSKLLEKAQFYATGYAALIIAFAFALCLGMMDELGGKCEEMMIGEEGVEGEEEDEDEDEEEEEHKPEIEDE